MHAAAEAYRPEKVVRLLAHLWGQATEFMETGKPAEALWVCQMGTTACIMQQLNARAGDIRCLTLHQVVLPGQESGSGLPACVYALNNGLPVPDLEIIPGHTKTFFDMNLKRFSLPAHEVPFMCFGTWLGALAYTADYLGRPLQHYLFRQRVQGGNLQKSPAAFQSAAVTTRRLTAGFQKSLEQLSLYAGEACHSFRTGGAVCLAASGHHAGQVSAELYQAQANSAFTYMAAHVPARMVGVPCMCCKKLWEDEPARKLMQAVSEIEQMIDAAHT